MDNLTNDGNIYYIAKNDIVVKRITKNILPTEAYDYFRVYSKHTDQLMFSCYDRWTLVNDHIIVLERQKREHIKNLFLVTMKFLIKNMNVKEKSLKFFITFSLDHKKA